MKGPAATSLCFHLCAGETGERAASGGSISGVGICMCRHHPSLLPLVGVAIVGGHFHTHPLLKQLSQITGLGKDFA